MISRRRFLTALAASVATPISGAEALTLPFWRSRSILIDSSSSAWLDELEWHYRRGYSLAVRTNQRVPELPLPRQGEEPRRDARDRPPLNGAAYGRVLRARFPDLRRHFAFEYYPWYGTLPWRHWDQWSRHPPYDLAVTSVPALGPYDSRDPKVLERHARWIAESGVGAINISWWGQGSYEDQSVPLVMDVMHDHDLKVTFHLEPYSNKRTDLYAEDVEYLLSNYGDKRRHDALLVLRDADGNEGPVLKSFATIMPPTSTDCFGRTSPVALYRPDSDWRRQTDLVRTTFRRDFDHLHLFADSGALDRVQAAGFDGIAMYDSFLRPDRWPSLARACRDFRLVFSFNINSGFDGISQREVPPSSCYSPPRFEPPATLDWTRPLDRERARLLAEGRIDDTTRMTLALQTDGTLTDNGAGFFMVYINSFNEWHEGTAFEPMRNSSDLLPDEIPFEYHNPADGSYRLGYLTSRLAPVLNPSLVADGALSSPVVP
jgi:sugar phosphate isomerase/epimerase